MTYDEQDDEARLFREGIELFNAGEWFEAHEVWEDAWRMATGQRKLFYQGLIQCAVTLEHVRRGNPRGVRSVWASCQTKFDGITGRYMAVDVPVLPHDMRHFIQTVLDMPAEAFAPGSSRGQAMPVDFATSPRIELEGDPFHA